MINKLGMLNDIPLYTDPLMEENSVLRGRKEKDTTYIIANPKTANTIYKIYLTKLRKEKLNKINGKIY